MPWVAKLIKEPKLKGGFNFVVGQYYHVSSAYTSTKLVAIFDLDGNNTTGSKDWAREHFDKPIWVESYTADTIADLLIQEQLKKLKDTMPQVKWNNP